MFLVSSALSLMNKQLLGDSGIEVNNEGVFLYTDKNENKQHIYIDFSVNFLKEGRDAKVVTNILRRWLNRKVRGITTAEFKTELRYNEDSGIYEAVINI